MLGQRLDMAKPLWELWLVEGLADNRWAIISKVHHCMVDGVAGTDLMQLMFDLEPDADARARRRPWTPRAHALGPRAASPRPSPRPWPTRCARLPSLPTRRAPRAQREGAASSRAGRVAQTVPSLAKQAVTPTARSLNGPIGPHRRWAWTEGKFEEFKAVRTAFGGTVNDVVLAAITGGFRDLLQGRGELSSEKLVVRSMVPVSVRKADQKGSLNNQVSAVFVDLPVGLPDPVVRLTAIRGQMDEYKRTMSAVDARLDHRDGQLRRAGAARPGRAGRDAGRPVLWCQAVTTNVPGPRFPLYVLGKRMVSAHAYVPIAGGTRSRSASSPT